jgi:hypothetical protein
MTAIVHTGPKLHVAYIVTYGSLPTQHGVRGTTQANGRGVATFSFKVSPGPVNGAASLPGSITAQIADATARGTASAPFRVFPALHFSASISLVNRQGTRAVYVSVRIAVRAQVQATLTLVGKRAEVSSARGTADGRHPLNLSMPVGTLPALSVAHVVVSVKTKDGVTDSRALSIAVRR